MASLGRPAVGLGAVAAGVGLVADDLIAAIPEVGRNGGAQAAIAAGPEAVAKDDVRFGVLGVGAPLSRLKSPICGNRIRS